MSSLSTGGAPATTNAQTVYVSRGGGFAPWLDLACRSVSRNLGTQGSQAEIVIPAWSWDTPGSVLHGAEIAVQVSEPGGGGQSTWFHGWLSNESARLDRGSNTYTVRANSVVPHLDKVSVGLGGWTERLWDGSRITYLERGSSVWVRYPRFTAMRRGVRRRLWHPREILNDIFAHLPSSWKIAVQLGDTSALATTNSEMERRGFVDFEFNGQTVLQAMEAIVQAYGDVAMVERFNGLGGAPRVYLDFLRIGQAAARKTVRVARVGDDAAATGANVRGINIGTEHADRIDRMVLAGQPYRLMVTVWTGDPDLARRLQKAWTVVPVTINITKKVPPATSGATATYTTTPVTKTNEEWVLDDPDYGKRNSDKFQAACEFVFRQYYLPPCARSRDGGIQVLKDNLVPTLRDPAAPLDPLTDKGSLYKTLPVQVFKTRLTYDTQSSITTALQTLETNGVLYSAQMSSSYGYDCGGQYVYGYGYESQRGFRVINTTSIDLVGALIPDVPAPGQPRWPLQLVSGAKVEGDGTVTLDEPATVMIYKSYCNGEEVKIHAEAQVAVTLSLSLDARLTCDTGQPSGGGSGLSLIGTDGLTMANAKDCWAYAQITNLGHGPKFDDGTWQDFPLYDPETGAEVRFPWCVYQNTFDPNADDPNVYQSKAESEITVLAHVTEQTVVKDDYALMREVARKQLRLKNRPKRAPEVELVYATNAFAPGDLVDVDGSGVPADNYICTGVEIDLDPVGGKTGTRLSMDNSRPEEKWSGEGGDL